MDSMSDGSSSELKTIDFENVPVDTISEKYLHIQNNGDKTLTYRISLLYILDNIDRVFKASITSTPVNPNENAEVKIVFKATNPGQSYTEYYLIDDTAGNTYRLTVCGQCFGPKIRIDKRKIYFRVCKTEKEERKEVINIINNTNLETTYQWYLPTYGQGNFQISTGHCGLVRPFETIPITMIFNGTALGIYNAELVCLVLNQEPIFVRVLASVVLPGNPLFNLDDHDFEKNWKRLSRSAHFMENSLRRLPHVPAASVFERFFDFSTGSVKDITKNISQTLCVTNHGQEDGFIQWMADPDNIFLIDPVACEIPPNESRLFTIRFRPNMDDEVYSFLLCGDYQVKKYTSENCDELKLKHTWFRIPCIGNTWSPCTDWISEWECPVEVVLPPTVPGRTTFTNFMLVNKQEAPMQFRFKEPNFSNFALLPMCGVVQGRGWQIVTVALEPNSCGNYIEAWDLIVNRTQKARLSLRGNAEYSEVELMSHGYNPSTHAMYEFPSTITGCTNYCTAYLHNLTRMDIHIRVLNSVPWLGGDNFGSILLPPKEVVRYHWWFFPKEPNKVYQTTVTCSCICLINGKPVGEPKDVFIHIMGFSELPDLKVLPKSTNLHDIIVGESVNFSVTLYNYGSCYFSSKLYHIIEGMGDDYSGDRFEIESNVNSLKPSNHCQVQMSVMPSGAGSRQIDIKYTVLFRTENDEIEEIQPITKTICTIWYDGIYPTIKIKRTISVNCPVILSNHCLWNLVNVDELNRAFIDCRPNKPVSVNIYAPDLCIRAGSVVFIFVMGCIYSVPVAWSLKREKICDCEMTEVQVGISLYEMKHTCSHRFLVELTPLNGMVAPDNPELLTLKFNYAYEGLNTLSYIMTLPNQRTIRIYLNIFATLNTKGVLTALRRCIYQPGYLAVLDCGKVPINNLDPVIRIVWLYNPTDVFTTWRLLRGNTTSPDSIIRCLLYFAEVPPLGKLAIPFAFMPTEMIDYEMIFQCSFGYDTVKLLVKGQGGLPNCIETRLDVPRYVEKNIRAAHRNGLVYLSMEHLTLPVMPTHSLSREIIAINNDTEHIIRFIWLPERIANIINVVMTPCWGVVQPKTTEWITMTVYSLQEPATFTTTVACEILDLTERKRYQRNELLRRNKMEKCKQEFMITEKGFFRPGINDSPPYVLDLEKPKPFYLAMSISISSKGQRDGYPRMLLRQMWEQTPPYDLMSSDINDYGGNYERASHSNNMTIGDVIRIIDGILWDALHSKMFKNQIEFYAKEEIPTYSQLVEVIENETKPQLSRRVTSGICDAIVNKAVFHIYGLNPKHETSILDAE